MSARRGTARDVYAPAGLDTLTQQAERALDGSCLDLDVFDLDLNGDRHHYEEHDDPTRHSPLGRLIRCFRVNGLLDEGNAISLPALRAIAQGEPLDDIVMDYGEPPAIVAEAARLFGRDPGPLQPEPVPSSWWSEFWMALAGRTGEPRSR